MEALEAIKINQNDGRAVFFKTLFKGKNVAVE